MEEVKMEFEVEGSIPGTQDTWRKCEIGSATKESKKSREIFMKLEFFIRGEPKKLRRMFAQNI